MASEWDVENAVDYCYWEWGGLAVDEAYGLGVREGSDEPGSNASGSGSLSSYGVTGEGGPN